MVVRLVQYCAVPQFVVRIVQYGGQTGRVLWYSMKFRMYSMDISLVQYGDYNGAVLWLKSI